MKKLVKLSALCLMSALLFSCVDKPEVEEEKPDVPGKKEEPADVNANISSSAEGTVSLTPMSALNAEAGVLDSHAGMTSRSKLSPIFGTYTTIGKEFTFYDDPLYPRLTRGQDGTYLLAYHYGVQGSAAGNQCLYLKSSDLLNWTPALGDGTTRSFLFQGGRAIGRPLYAGAYFQNLPDGRIMAVCAYRKDDTTPGSNYRYNHADNGIAIRYSSDSGKTWTDDQRINVGTCWEPCVCVLPSGQIQIYYTDSDHVIENVWPGYGGTGVAMIYSDDNGKTWTPSGLDHMHVIRQCLDVRSGNYLYTDQMPSVIVLHDGKSLAAAMESNMTLAEGINSRYKISLAYSDANGSWGPQDSMGQCPPDRVNEAFYGCAPFLNIFPSGETLVTYNTDNKYFMRIGDHRARNFGEEMVVFPETPVGQGYWGSTYMLGSHKVAMAMGGTGHVLQLGQFYLNHAIKAATHKTAADGDNGEWKSEDEAFCLCSKGKVTATLRCSQDAQNIYFLIEVLDRNLSENDYFQLFLSPSSEAKVSSKVLRIKGNMKDLFLTFNYVGVWKNNPSNVVCRVKYQGTVNDSSNVDGGYFAEIAVPRSAISVEDGKLLANFSIFDVDNSKEDSLCPVSELSTQEWVPIFGL